MLPYGQIDISEDAIMSYSKKLLEFLLHDNTTGNNIIWATDNYKDNGLGFMESDQITMKLITGKHNGIIQPRVAKPKAIQEKRTRDKAEVFTPSWMCNRQNNQIDEAWFGRKAKFNAERNESWSTYRNPIDFSDVRGKTWEDYVKDIRLEVSCGEAPYITSRYDTVNEHYIESCKRIGLLDRKLRVISENRKTKSAWITWAKIALQSIYGFDYQGDNVLLARENVLFTVIEHYYDKFASMPKKEDVLEFARIISWNIWQMDGIDYTIPNSRKEEATQLSMIEDVKPKIIYSKVTYAKIKDWNKDVDQITFKNLVEGLK